MFREAHMKTTLKQKSNILSLEEYRKKKFGDKPKTANIEDYLASKNVKSSGSNIISFEKYQKKQVSFSQTAAATPSYHFQKVSMLVASCLLVIFVLAIQKQSPQPNRSLASETKSSLSTIKHRKKIKKDILFKGRNPTKRETKLSY